MKMDKVLYKDGTLDPLIGTKIHQEGDKVIFNHLGESDDSGHSPFGFHIEIDADMYQKGIDDLLKTGKCIMKEPSGVEGLFSQTLTLEKIGANLHITCGQGTIFFSNFDFNKLVL
jgi:hypothetical protein